MRNKNMSLRAVLASLLVVGLTLATLHEARGQISYSTAGSIYSENFDSLPNTPQNTSLQATIPWTDNSTSSASQTSLAGWYLYHPILQTEGGANGHQRLRIGAGTANTGAFMSWGASGSTDRALGSLASNTLATNPLPDLYFGVRLSNQTGQTLDRFTLSYNGEQWRDGGDAAPNAQGLTFMWSTTATAISDPNTSFTTVAALGYTSPIFTNTASGNAIDGNTAGRVVVAPVLVTGINWQPGTDLWLRWDDINNTGNDHGLGVDDLNFSALVAVPEPSTFALIGVGFAGLIAVHRFRRR